MSQPSTSTAHLRPLVPFDLSSAGPSYGDALEPTYDRYLSGDYRPSGHDGPADARDATPLGAGGEDGDDSDDGAAMFADLSFAEVVDELIARFLINLPPEETTLMRVYWQAEQAHWFYEDYIRPLNPSLPSMRQAKFTEMLIQTSPIYRSMGEIDYEGLWAEYVAYKMMVPCCGGILVNRKGDRVLMVRGWKAGASWCFPRGKINQDEPEEVCAVREVFEEVGFDISALIHTAERVQTQINAQTVTMFIIPGIDEKTVFEAQTKKEIGAIEWVRVIELPTWSGKKVVKPEKGKKSKRFYNVTPFVGPLKLWLRDRGYSAHGGTPAKKKRERTNDPKAKLRQLQPYFADSEGGERELQPYFSDMSGNEAFSDEDALHGVGAGAFPTPRGGKGVSARVQAALERNLAARASGKEPTIFFDTDRGPTLRPPAAGRGGPSRKTSVEDYARQTSALDQLFAKFMDRQTESMAGAGDGGGQGQLGEDNKAGLERLFGDSAQEGRGGGQETQDEKLRREEDDAVAQLLGAIGSTRPGPNGVRGSEAGAVRADAQAQTAVRTGPGAEGPKTDKARGLLAMLNSRPMASGSAVAEAADVQTVQASQGAGQGKSAKQKDLLALLSSGQPKAIAPAAAPAAPASAGPAQTGSIADERARKQRALLESITAGVDSVGIDEASPQPPAMGWGASAGSSQGWGEALHNGFEVHPPSAQQTAQQYGHHHPLSAQAPYSASNGGPPAQPSEPRLNPALNDQQRNLLGALGMGARPIGVGQPAHGGWAGWSQHAPPNAYGTQHGSWGQPYVQQAGPQAQNRWPHHAPHAPYGGPPAPSHASQATPGWGQPPYHPGDPGPAHPAYAAQGPSARQPYPAPGPAVGAGPWAAGPPRPAQGQGPPPPPFHHPMARPPNGMGPGGVLGGMMDGSGR